MSDLGKTSPDLFKANPPPAAPIPDATTAAPAPAGYNYAENNPLLTPEQRAAGLNAAPAQTFGQSPAGNTIAPPIQTTPYTAPTVSDATSQMGEGIKQMLPGTEGTFSEGLQNLKQGASDLFSPGPTSEQVTARARDILSADTTGRMTYADAMKAAAAEGPGILRTYGPAAAAGIAALSAFGGFKPTTVPQSELKTQLLKPATQRIAEQGQQRQYYIQNLPGVKYDQYGAPTYDTGLGITSVMPRKFAAGGTVEELYTQVLGRAPDAEGLAFWKSAFGDTVDASEKASFMNSVNQVLSAAPEKTAELAPNIQTVNDLYAGIGRTGIGTGADQIDQGGRDFWLDELASGNVSADQLAAKFNTSVGNYLTEKPADVYSNQVIFDDLVKNAYGGIGRTGFGEDVSQIDTGGYKFWMDALRNGTFNDANGKLDVSKFNAAFNDVVDKYKKEFPNNDLTKYVSQFQPVNVTTKWLTNTGGTVAPGTGVGNVAPVNMATAYSNVNAGLGYNTPAGVAAPTVAARQAAFAPTLNKYSTAQADITKALAPPAAAPTVEQPYNKAPFTVTGPTSITAPVQQNWNVAPSPVMQDPRVVAAMQATTPAPNTPPTPTMNMGGIASLAAGGYPRRTGQISGPGTETSDSIPAMLSDGEFVMTAKAVRGAGKGDRRAGAKRMYALMNQLEQNAARG